MRFEASGSLRLACRRMRAGVALADSGQDGAVRTPIKSSQRLELPWARGRKGLVLR
jgi:hypothetical protein